MKTDVECPEAHSALALHLGGTCEHLESRIKCGRSEESWHAHLLGRAPESTYLRRGGII